MPAAGLRLTTRSYDMPATRGSMDAFASATADREIVITRLLDAPHELVFDSSATKAARPGS